LGYKDSDILIISFLCSQYSTGITPIMEAAISGHEILFNILLDHVRKTV